MLGLIIDTSRETALIGLIENGQISSFKTLEGAKKLSSLFFPELQLLLREANTKIQDLAYIAVGIGPGSYMGVRTGATIAKTLAFSINLPLIEFPSPIAFLPEEIDGSFAFVGDAKMQELFLLTGQVENQELGTLSSPILLKKEELEEKIEPHVFIIREDSAPLKPTLKWATQYANTQFLAQNFQEAADLQLTYLR